MTKTQPKPRPEPASIEEDEATFRAGQERDAVLRYADRMKKRNEAPRFKVDASGETTKIVAQHPSPDQAHAMLCDTFAAGDTAFTAGLLTQIGEIARSGKTLTTFELNALVATVHEIAPRDPIEALLAVQMAAVHNATMVAARRLNHVETIPQQDSASNMLNKLVRTFAVQVDTLKRYRGTGEQKVTVQHQHVHVSANQAVVGVRQGGGGTDEKASQSHAPGSAPAKAGAADATGPALLSHQQAFGMPMPSPGGERLAGVPHARRRGGSTERQG